MRENDFAAVVTGAWAQGSDPDPIELTSTDGETWTLASMPDYDVELEVEYYDELVYSTREEVDELYPKAQRFIEEVDALLAEKS